MKKEGKLASLGGDGMLYKNYQLDSFHLPELFSYLSTFFAYEYVQTYVFKTMIKKINLFN